MLYIGAGLVVLLFIMNGQWGGKDASAGLEATRSFSADYIGPGETIVATYHPTTPNYFAILETVPAGWAADKTVSPDGKIRTSADGGDITITWTAPGAVGQATFTGQYFTTPDEEWTNFPQNTLGVCGHQSSSQCSGGDRYWYDTCGHIESIREDCVAAGCDAWSAMACNGFTIQQSRTCYTGGCTADVCQSTPNTETQTATSAPNTDSGVCRWQCANGVCGQNTAADTNYDGCVHDTEFPVSVNNWKTQAGGITDMVFPQVVGKWKSLENCQ